jgi:hypothetical protein
MKKRARNHNKLNKYVKIYKNINLSFSVEVHKREDYQLESTT